MPEQPDRSVDPTRRGVLRLLAGAALGGGGTALLAACTSSSPSPARHSPAVPRDAIHVTDFGAKGDGRTDDLAAIRRALAALKPGGTLQFDRRGIFCHSEVLTVSTPRVSLIGPGRLLATAEATSAVQIDAPDVRLTGLTLSMGTTTQRWSTPDQHKLYLGGHSGVRLDDVTIDGSAAAGVFCEGASHFRLRNVQVNDTRADGIHMTNGAHHGRLESPRITRSGDDGVAVVSYLADQAPCHDITVLSPTVHTTTGGRGISVVGGYDVRYSDVEISHSDAAAVYIACEGGDFVTSSTRHVAVLGGRITGANVNAAIDHGAVLIYSGRGGGRVSDVTVQDLTVRATRPGASRQIGVVADAADDLVSDVRFVHDRLAATPTPYQGNAPRNSFSLDDVTAAGTAVQVTG